MGSEVETYLCKPLGLTSGVIAGLDPAIHLASQGASSQAIDARVAGAFTRVFDALLPTHDGARLTSALRLHAAGSNIATVSVAGRNCVACRQED